MMVTAIRWMAAGALAVGMVGCVKGPRTVQEVVQYYDDLAVDTSQVPEQWLERSTWKKQAGEIRTIRVKSPHRVKVILVPDEAAQPATRNAPAGQT